MLGGWNTQHNLYLKVTYPKKKESNAIFLQTKYSFLEEKEKQNYVNSCQVGWISS